MVYLNSWIKKNLMIGKRREALPYKGGKTKCDK